MLRNKRSLVLMIACAIGSTLSLGSGYAQDLPRGMTWSSYEVGSTGYAEASAIANGFGKKYGTRVRIQPSGSSIGRLEPLVRKRVDFSFLGSEGFFATEGLYDFAGPQWGPQDLRVIAGRRASFGIVTTQQSGIKQVKDAKGKRVAYIAGNTSVSVKCDAMLTFGGLTRGDVDVRMFPTYDAAMRSLARGKADATCTTPTPSQMYELAESPRGIYWVPLPGSDKQGWDRVHSIQPYFEPREATVGAGVSEDHPVALMGYRYPVLFVRADMSEQAVYDFTKAMDKTYDMYKDATAVMSRWKLSDAATPPIDAPFHPGTIKYLKEKGIWTDDMQVWNDQHLNRLKALQKAWKKTQNEAGDKTGAAFDAVWQKNRLDALDSLSPAPRK